MMQGLRRMAGVGLIFVLTGVALAQAPATSTPAASPDTSAPSAAAESPAAAAGGATESEAAPAIDTRRALFALAVGIVTVLGLIIVAKTNAFLALIAAAILVSLIAPGELASKVTRVAVEFGNSCGKIGIVIAAAAVIGKCMLDSGAADRIVRAFLRLFGERQSPTALMGSGFVLAVPVFFDTVFYLLVPLARSLHRKTGRHYLRYLLAIVAGGAITHTLVPPTPGPLQMSANLGVGVGEMMLIGLLVALPSACVGLVFAAVADRLMPTPMRQIGSEPEPAPLPDHELPPLWLALLPVVLPVVLIGAFTFLEMSLKATLAQGSQVPRLLQQAYDVMAILGNPNLALLVATVVAMGMVYVQRQLTLRGLAHLVEVGLMSGGVIILITAAGGAFGEMLKAANVGHAIRATFGSQTASGAGLLVMGFSVAALLKIAQGSSTVAMITASAMLAGVITGGSAGFHPVYLATAIGAGSLVGSWMNDSGFWIFAKMGGLTEIEALKSWTILLVLLALVSFGTTIVLSIVWPYPLGFS